MKNSLVPASSPRQHLIRAMALSVVVVTSAVAQPAEATPQPPERERSSRLGHKEMGNKPIGKNQNIPTNSGNAKSTTESGVTSGHQQEQCIPQPPQVRNIRTGKSDDATREAAPRRRLSKDREEESSSHHEKSVRRTTNTNKQQGGHGVQSIQEEQGIEIKSTQGETSIRFEGKLVWEGTTSGHVAAKSSSINGDVHAAAFDGDKVIWENRKGAAAKVQGLGHGIPDEVLKGLPDGLLKGIPEHMFKEMKTHGSGTSSGFTSSTSSEMK